MAPEFRRLINENGDVSTKRLAEVMGTTLTGMLLVAYVDNKLHWHEHQTLIEFVRAIGDHVSAQQVLQYLDSSAHLLEDIPQSQWAGLFEVGRRLPSEAKVTVLAMCTKLAFADGHLSPEESNLIHQIAEWINIDPYGRKLWKEGVRGALEAAQLRGFEYTGIENLENEDT